MGEYFPERKSFVGKVKVELDLSNYPTKAVLKNGTGFDTSKFSKKTDLKCDLDKLDNDKLRNVPTNLSNLKIKVDKLDVDKIVPVPIDLSKLSNVIKINIVKKDVYNSKIENIEDKISDITNVATNTTLNAKINEVKDKILSITNLATTTTLTAVENKIPNISNLVKKVTITQKLVKLKIKLLLIMIMINILLLKNLIS